MTMVAPSYSGARLVYAENHVVKSGPKLDDQARKLREGEELFGDVRYPRSAYVQGSHLLLERIHGPGLIVNCDHWEAHLEKLFAMVDHNLGRSEQADVGHLASAKIDDLAAKHCFLAPHRRAVLDFLRPLAEELVVPVGPCHGDLTLCNALCGCSEGGVGHVVLVDPIAPWCESPLQDIVKLAQDLVHGWLPYHVKDVDPERMASARARFDARYGDMYGSREGQIIDILSLLRIMPYTEHDEAFGFVWRCIERCHRNLSSSSPAPV